MLNERKFTTAKDNVGSVGVINWNEHLFFEPKNVVSVASLSICEFNLSNCPLRILCIKYKNIDLRVDRRS